MLRSLFSLTFTAQFLCLIKCSLGYNGIIDSFYKVLLFFAMISF